MKPKQPAKTIAEQTAEARDYADIMIEVKDMERRISILELQAEVERLRAGLHLMAAFNTAMLDILNRKPTTKPSAK